MPAANEEYKSKDSIIKDIGWPHAVIAVVGLILILLMLDYSFGDIELPGGIKIELNPPSTPVNTPIQTSVVSPLSAENAIRSYYALIKEQQYVSAWEMAADYCSSKGLSFEEYTDEWERTGTAQIVEPLYIDEDSNKATVTLTLYYPKLDTRLVMLYELKRDFSLGSDRFGFWIFHQGKIIE